jgi:cbb3-type cytochrome oxidase subunit 3
MEEIFEQMKVFGELIFVILFLVVVWFAFQSYFKFMIPG